MKLLINKIQDLLLLKVKNLMYNLSGKISCGKYANIITLNIIFVILFLYFLILLVQKLQAWINT